MRAAVLDPRVRDALLAIVLAVGSFAQLGATHETTALLVLWAALTTLPLALRGAAPVAVGLGIQLVFLAGTPWVRDVELLAQGVSVFLVATYVAALGPRSWRGSVLAGTGSLVLLVLQGAVDPRFEATGAVVANAVYATMAWGVAAAVRVHIEHSRQSEQVAASVLQTSEANTRLAVQAERARLARELHDVLGHSISVMVLRARGGVHEHHVDPAAGLEALRDVEEVGTRALADVRLLLELDQGRDTELGPDPAPVRHHPLPGLDDLADLAGRTTSAGLQVDLSVRGDPRAVNDGLSLAAYRIVQEALTNVMRHSGSGVAHVVLDWTGPDLVVEVRDEGPAVPDPGGGRGLVGMAERAALVGGRLVVRRDDDGGFAVRAQLPVGR
ncbi:Signal transduction histidine kinase [Nocardioides scoriae]|uniref:histidine kinase n=1 Tax=Nocardioides scoriae TaxID=642780 RepID=A0A1H1LDI7_9ACTN|nr:histidine kinase [Nocardioides scoriae]SDR72573.1 Signal transduction histidine kinase [Nocardioides scoriae]